ncbi:flavin reductase [Mobilitalea sibirica]|uniref:Flavin reductase n=1 Tax=Mobilitalea sibirica TaxID=1462919 RepID=A0A8J7GWY5_9FIRM|nr:flavin reductase [Mobilitalea sibirica]MBH1939474.1 flavin reductase [Mobilitalea sibirica]
MSKISVPITNNFCPQTLFLYGTYKEDGTANFGLFCWLSYIWDSELGVMACIGGDKLTKDRIKQTGVFSANLVTEKLLTLSDYFGNKDGYSRNKMNIKIDTVKGIKLDVPILTDSPLSFELQVFKNVELKDGEVFLCKIRNVLMDEKLCNQDISIEERIKEIAPVSTTYQTYFSWDGNRLGGWGELQEGLPHSI